MIATVLYVVLVVACVPVIILHAWLVRRLASLRQTARTLQHENEELRSELAGLSEAVQNLERGKESNAVSIQALQREITGLQEQTKAFLTEHPALQQEFGQAAAEAAAGTPPAPAADDP